MKKYFAFAGIAAAAFTIFTATDVKAATETELCNKIVEVSGYEVIKDYYADYDCDGSEEVFAVVKGDGEGGGEQLWFANDKMSKCVFSDGNSLYCFTESDRICEVSDDQKIFIMEMGGYGSGSNSLCCYLKDGDVVVMRASEGLTHVEGADFTIHPSAFDYYIDSCGMGTGHTYKPYYIKWTGDGFKEYTAKKISLKKFKSFTGAKKYVRKIKKEGYTIDNVLRRSNGIININVHKKDDYDGIMNDNVNFTLKDGTVKLIKIYDDYGSEVVRSSSYGGVYVTSRY